MSTETNIVEAPTQAEIYGMWDAGILSWKLWPQQLQIYNKIRTLDPMVWLFVILCARQFGKSVLAVLMAIEDCLRFPNTGTLIIGPTIDQTFAIVEPRFHMLTKDAPPGLITPVKSEKKWVIGESELYVGGFDRVSAGQRGKTLKNIYIEEVRDSHPDKYKRTMRGDLAPALTHSKGGRLNFVTTLPDIPDHPFIIETMEQAKSDGAFESYTIEENNALTREEKDRTIAMAGGIESEEAKRELFNIQTRNRKRTIAPDYDEDVHVKEFFLPEPAYLQVTGDWGGVRDKTVALFHTYDFINDMILIWDELKFDENTSTKHIVHGKPEMPGEAATPGLWSLESGHDIHLRTLDNAGQTVIDLTQDPKDGGYGYECQRPPKTDWKSAANQMSAIFSFRNPIKIMIHPRCKFLRATLRSGMFNEKRTDFDRNDFLGHMDAAAALMYAIRVQNRENPLNVEIPEGFQGSQFIRPALPEDHVVAEAMVPKQFASSQFSGQFKVKKFGKFR